LKDDEMNIFCLAGSRGRRSTEGRREGRREGGREGGKEGGRDNNNLSYLAPHNISKKLVLGRVGKWRAARQKLE
jgi:hypothetical protein